MTSSIPGSGSGSNTPPVTPPNSNSNTTTTNVSITDTLTPAEVEELLNSTGHVTIKQAFSTQTLLAAAARQIKFVQQNDPIANDAFTKAFGLNAQDLISFIFSLGAAFGTDAQVQQAIVQEAHTLNQAAYDANGAINDFNMSINRDQTQNGNVQRAFDSNQQSLQQVNFNMTHNWFTSNDEVQNYKDLYQQIVIGQYDAAASNFGNPLHNDVTDAYNAYVDAVNNFNAARAASGGFSGITGAVQLALARIPLDIAIANYNGALSAYQGKLIAANQAMATFNAKAADYNAAIAGINAGLPFASQIPQQPLYDLPDNSEVALEFPPSYPPGVDPGDITPVGFTPPKPMHVEHVSFPPANPGYFDYAASLPGFVLNTVTNVINSADPFEQHSEDLVADAIASIFQPRSKPLQFIKAVSNIAADLGISAGGVGQILMATGFHSPSLEATLAIAIYKSVSMQAELKSLKGTSDIGKLIGSADKIAKLESQIQEVKQAVVGLTTLLAAQAVQSAAVGGVGLLGTSLLQQLAPNQTVASLALTLSFIGAASSLGSSPLLQAVLSANLTQAFQSAGLSIPGNNVLQLALAVESFVLTGGLAQLGNVLGNQAIPEAVGFVVNALAAGTGFAPLASSLIDHFQESIPALPTVDQATVLATLKAAGLNNFQATLQAGIIGNSTESLQNYLGTLPPEQASAGNAVFLQGNAAAAINQAFGPALVQVLVGLNIEASLASDFAKIGLLQLEGWNKNLAEIAERTKIDLALEQLRAPLAGVILGLVFNSAIEEALADKGLKNPVVVDKLHDALMLNVFGFVPGETLPVTSLIQRLVDVAITTKKTVADENAVKNSEDFHKVMDEFTTDLNAFLVDKLMDPANNIMMAWSALYKSPNIIPPGVLPI